MQGDIMELLLLLTTWTMFVSASETAKRESSKECFGGVISYEKTSGMSFNVPPAQVLISGSSQAVTPDCASLCRQFTNCVAFTVEYKSGRCQAFDRDSVGRRNLLRSTAATNYFEEVCFRGVTNYSEICGSRVWAFERIVGSYLEGFDNKEDLNVATKTDCERLCLSETTFTCRSAEYDEIKQICRLSREDRRTQPLAFKRLPGSSVDYLENQCLKPTPSCHYDTVKGVTIETMDDLQYASTSIECQQTCDHTHLFSCWAFAFDHRHSRCYLSGDDAVNPSGQRINLPTNPDIIYGERKCTSDVCSNGLTTYEKVPGSTMRNAAQIPLIVKTIGQGITLDCLQSCKDLGHQCPAVLMDYSTNTCFRLDRGTQGRREDIVPYLAHSFFEETCLRGNFKTCHGKAWAFERIPHAELMGLDDKVIAAVQSRRECEEACLEETKFLCRSCEYNYITTECKLSQRDRHSSPELFRRTDSEIDYLENQCLSSDSDIGCSLERMPGAAPHQADFVQTMVHTEDECNRICFAFGAFCCRSAAFSQAIGKCSISSADATLENIRPDAGSVLLQRVCLTSRSAAGLTPIQTRPGDAATNSLPRTENPTILGGRCTDTKPGQRHYEKITGFVLKAETLNALLSLPDQKGITADCQLKCDENNDCWAFNLDYNSSECIALSRDSTKSRNDLTIENATGYFESICLKNVDECGRLWTYERYINQELRGHAKDAIGGITKVECQERCVQETRYQCKSATYYYNTHECHMSEEDRFTQPESFVAAIDADYLENQCGNMVSITARQSTGCEYVAVVKDQVLSFVDRNIQANNQLECESACERETQFVCRSYSFTGMRNVRQQPECYLSADTRNSVGAQLQSYPGALYVERTCRHGATGFPPPSSAPTSGTNPIRFPAQNSPPPQNYPNYNNMGMFQSQPGNPIGGYGTVQAGFPIIPNKNNIVANGFPPPPPPGYHSFQGAGSQQLPVNFQNSAAGTNNFARPYPGQGQLPSGLLPPGQMHPGLRGNFPGLLPGQAQFPGALPGQAQFPGALPGQSQFPGAVPGPSQFPVLPGSSQFPGAHPGLFPGQQLPPLYSQSSIPTSTQARCSNDADFTYERTMGFAVRPTSRTEQLGVNIPSESLALECLKACSKEGQRCPAFMIQFPFSPSPVPCVAMERTIGADRSQLFPRGDAAYFEKLCLRSRGCNKAWTFDRVVGFQMDVNYERDIPNVLSKQDCEDICLQETTLPCRSAAYVYSLRLCRLTSETRRSQPEAFRYIGNDVDYLENQCSKDLSECEYTDINGKFNPFTEKRKGRSENLEVCKEKCNVESQFPCRSVSFDTVSGECHMSADDRYSTSAGPNIMVDRPGFVYSERGGCGQVKVDCTTTEMVVTMRFGAPFSGRVYAKGNPQLCFIPGNNQNHVTMNIPIGTQCGTIEESQGRYANEVVIQQHPIIMTDNDKTYRVVCSFDIKDKTLTFSAGGGGAIDVTVPRLGAPPPLVTNTAPTPNVKLRITNKSGQDVNAVNLGEELFLRIEPDQNSAFGIFAKNLVARSEFLDYLPLLDANGCPSDANVFPTPGVERGSKALVSTFKAFRFASTGRVNFEVQVQFCQDECPTVRCAAGANYGRRRRNADLMNEMKMKVEEMQSTIINETETQQSSNSTSDEHYLDGQQSETSGLKSESETTISNSSEKINETSGHDLPQIGVQNLFRENSSEWKTSTTRIPANHYSQQYAINYNNNINDAISAWPRTANYPQFTLNVEDVASTTNMVRKTPENDTLIPPEVPLKLSLEVGSEPEVLRTPVTLDPGVMTPFNLWTHQQAMETGGNAGKRNDEEEDICTPKSTVVVSVVAILVAQIALVGGVAFWVRHLRAKIRKANQSAFINIATDSHHHHLNRPKATNVNVTCSARTHSRPALFGSSLTLRGLQNINCQQQTSDQGCDTDLKATP